MMKISLITDCTKLSHEQAIAKAAELGAVGVQIYATRGSFCPDMSMERKLFYKDVLRSNNMAVSALCGDMGGHGFEVDEDNELRVEKTKRIVDLALMYGTGIVTTHIGVIPDDKDDPRYAVMLKALTACGKYAESQGATLAIETGPEKAKTLKMFIEDTEGGVGVNLDPANFVMVAEQDPVEAVELLHPYIVHTHAKDGRKLVPGFPAADVYHGKATQKIYEELPIGKGDVDWDAYLGALIKHGYDGYLTIEREAGPDPFDDIKGAIGFLNEKLTKLYK